MAEVYPIMQQQQQHQLQNPVVCPPSRYVLKNSNVQIVIIEQSADGILKDTLEECIRISC